MSQWKANTSQGGSFVYSLNDQGTNLFYAHVLPGWDNSGGRTSHKVVAHAAKKMAAAPELEETVKSLLWFIAAAGIPPRIRNYQESAKIVGEVEPR